MEQSTFETWKLIRLIRYNFLYLLIISKKQQKVERAKSDSYFRTLIVCFSLAPSFIWCFCCGTPRSLSSPSSDVIRLIVRENTRKTVCAFAPTRFQSRQATEQRRNSMHKLCENTLFKEKLNWYVSPSEHHILLWKNHSANDNMQIIGGSVVNFIV